MHSSPCKGEQKVHMRLRLPSNAVWRGQVRVAKEELDAVSDLRYAWKKLRKCASEASDQLASLQARRPFLSTCG